MKEKDFLDIVPAQYTGNKIEAEASVELKGDKEAVAFMIQQKSGC